MSQLSKGRPLPAKESGVQLLTETVPIGAREWIPQKDACSSAHVIRLWSPVMLHDFVGVRIADVVG
jgi:hypothetical protein